jgi:hypothetical protein
LYQGFVKAQCVVKTFIVPPLPSGHSRRTIRGEKASDFSYEHDLAVQETLLAACGLADSK